MLNCHPGRTAHLGQDLHELAARKALEMQGSDRLITLQTRLAEQMQKLKS
jgi:hypothetical protein